MYYLLYKICFENLRIEFENYVHNVEFTIVKFCEHHIFSKYNGKELNSINLSFVVLKALFILNYTKIIFHSFQDLCEKILCKSDTLTFQYFDEDI